MVEKKYKENKLMKMSRFIIFNPLIHSFIRLLIHSFKPLILDLKHDQREPFSIIQVNFYRVIE
jgi:hypothetical protein